MAYSTNTSQVLGQIFYTDSCLTELTDFVLTGMNEGMHAGMILIDLQKAFDTLDYKVFLEKMACLGLNTPIMKWFGSYLSNVKSFVSVDDFFSEAGILNCCVPQGSISGPLLFLIYISYLPWSLSKNGFHLYADDTGIFHQDKDVHKIEDVLNKEFLTLNKWFVNNRLSIHFVKNKTKCIPFSKTRHSWKLNISYRDHITK